MLARLNQKGVAHLLLLLVVLGILAFVFITNTSSFKHELFSSLYPIPISSASEVQHLIAGWSIIDQNSADVATTLGIKQTVLYGDDTNYKNLNQILQQKNMGEITGTISNLLTDYECHRTYTTAPPPQGVQPFCPQDRNPNMDHTLLMKSVEDYLVSVKSNNLIKAHIIYMSWPYWDLNGQAKPILEEIHQLVKKYSPQVSTVCYFPASILPDKKYSWNKERVNDFTPIGCDMVALGVSLPSYNHQTAPNINLDTFDFSMKDLLPIIFSSLKNKGWYPANQPLIGMVYAFGGEVKDKDTVYLIPRKQDILTQTESFCKNGANNLIFAYMSLSAYNNPQTPVNNQGLKDGVKQGIEKCNTIWNPNPITAENALPGTNSWVPTQPTWLGTNYRFKHIEGYPLKTSVNKGEDVEFAVSSELTANFKAEVYRMGWYNGVGARLMQKLDNLPGSLQPTPETDPQTGLIEANWPVSFKLTLPPDWTSGIYMVKLIASTGHQGFIPFVVKDPSRKSSLILVHTVATEVAYNPWGGKSLYKDLRYTGAEANEKRSYKVSLNRPFMSDTGAGEFFFAEYPMVRFLEKNGYDVSYITDVDAHQDSNLLLGHKGILIVGHDEYWSKEMRNNYENAVSQKVSLGLFAGNDAYWQIRYEKDKTGRENRTIVGYREPEKDPLFNVDNSVVTTQFRKSPVNRAEQSLLGEMYGSIGGAMLNQNDTFPLIVKNPNHWVFAGTDLKAGDSVPGIIGREFDQLVNNPFQPARPINVEILSESPVVNSVNVNTVANATIYTASSSATVFNGGSIWWSMAIDDYIPAFSGSRNVARHPNQKAEIVTKNIINHFLAN